MNILSHPNKQLIKHLKEVAEIAKDCFSGNTLNFELDGIQKIEQEHVADLAYLAGAFHDIAKATSYFQEYIRNPDKTHTNKKNHAHLSSLFVFFLSTKYVNRTFESDLLKEMIPALLYTSVKRHHGNLKNLSNELLIEPVEKELLKHQINSIDPRGIQNIIDEMISPININCKWDDFIDYIINEEYDEIFDNLSLDILEDEYPNFSDSARMKFFYLHQAIYSALMYADKEDVILEKQVKPTITQTNISHKLVKFREDNGFNLPKTEINKLKNEAYRKSINNLEKIFNPAEHIYSLTLPTGLGKTLTAFGVAQKIRELAKLDNSRIIINIPFTSIIDQNFDVYQEVLKTNSTDCLLKHHHLSEPIYKPINENTLDYNESQFLIETWQSETIITTFVQFLETILSCDKTKLMKLAHLKNAVVLLDEIQTIPYPLWETIRKSFLTLGKTFNMYFVLISATQPLIFTPGKDILEIVPNYQKYFKFFNRTKLRYYPNVISFDDFQDKITSYALENLDKDILIILNTKMASRECFEHISELDIPDTEFFYLSTLITPFERKNIISKIKEESSKRKIIVSTQLVEAGVDISVQTIFRQLSPVDSIIQSAGRANRYNETQHPCDVFLYEIQDFSKATNKIYGSDLILKTKNVLKEFRCIEESEYLKLIEKYFVEVRKQSDETSNDLLNSILKLDFAEVDLKLIAERNSESVFIQLNEKAKVVWEEFIRIYNDTNSTKWDRKERFSNIKADFYDYVINVPIPFGEKMINFDSEKINGFYVSTLESPSSFYSYSESNYIRNIGYTDTQIVLA